MPNRWNEDDLVNFSHALPRRLSAEQMLDSIAVATGRPLQFSNLPEGMRAAQLPVCAPFRQEWPCEQQCLHELLRNRTLLPEGWRTRIASAPMQLFNSPHGQFIRHVWGGATGTWGSSFDLRRKAFDDELRPGTGKSRAGLGNGGGEIFVFHDFPSNFTFILYESV